ncbi:hypothetical protein SOVF_082650 [Spinacia oleracea]|nr:hypothetical protein SOVF_082650 [Spinacia oleracea]
MTKTRNPSKVPREKIFHLSTMERRRNRLYPHRRPPACSFISVRQRPQHPSQPPARSRVTTKHPRNTCAIPRAFLACAALLDNPEPLALPRILLEDGHNVFAFVAAEYETHKHVLNQVNAAGAGAIVGAAIAVGTRSKKEIAGMAALLSILGAAADYSRTELHLLFFLSFIFSLPIWLHDCFLVEVINFDSRFLPRSVILLTLNTRV